MEAGGMTDKLTFPPCRSSFEANGRTRTPTRTWQVLSPDISILSFVLIEIEKEMYLVVPVRFATVEGQPSRVKKQRVVAFSERCVGRLKCTKV
jgi:hypothetical protein